MARRRVVFENFHQYDKFHTKKTKMYSGVEMTTLYPIKETEHYWVSCQVWAYCASNFKMKKKFLPEIIVNIPVISDQRTIDFLDEHCWHDWVERELKAEDSDTIETLSYLRKLYPNHEIIYFYELNNILSMFTNGMLLEERIGDNNLQHIQHYNRKYSNDFELRENSPEATALYKKYHDFPDRDDKFKTQLYREYADFINKLAWEKNNQLDIFRSIGENSVCYPVAYSSHTADWAIEKYGKPLEYSNAGEIFFVVTKDNKIYYESKRHF